MSMLRPGSRHPDRRGRRRGAQVPLPPEGCMSRTRVRLGTSPNQRALALKLRPQWTTEEVEHGTQPVTSLLELAAVGRVIGVGYLGAQIPDNRVQHLPEEFGVDVAQVELHRGLLFW